MAFLRKLDFNSVSTHLLLSTVALPVSIIAFAVAYTRDDPFWSLVWMAVVLPLVWVAVVFLGAKDSLKRRSLRPIAGSVLMLTPTAILIIAMLSPRFVMHQLFTFKPIDYHLPSERFAFIQVFSVCAPQTTCTPHSTVTKTKTFRLAKVPDGCCFLEVVNGWGEKHKVEAFRILLNGEQVNLPSSEAVQFANVELRSENDLAVHLTGTTGDYIVVAIWLADPKAKTKPTAN
jgi:hypothetical protein